MPMRSVPILAAAVFALFLAAYQRPAALRAEGRILANGPIPAVVSPPDNPLTDAKVRLGAQLYFDGRLSKDGTVSCASCHDPEHGWADPHPTSEGVGQAKGGRNAPTVLNAAFHRVQFWDGRAPTLEDQAVGPIQNPVEMAMTMPETLGRLKTIPGYVEQFKVVFGSEPTEETLGHAIAAFERTVLSTDSPYDRYLAGDATAMSASALRGKSLFEGKAHCSVCHSGPNFTDSRFHNLGVGYANGKYADVGRFGITKQRADMGAFKTPGLRSIALTGPYMHDGSEATLDAVIELYDRGGNRNPNLDPAMVPLNLTAREKADLVEFMKALTGAPLNIKKPELPQ